MTATAYARRSYSGAAPAAELASGITATSTSISVDNGAGFPTAGPFFIVLARGTPAEEKVEVDSRSSNTFNVASTSQRGVDGTTAASHAAGVTVEHVWTATDADEANAAAYYTVGQVTTKGDLLAATGSRQLARVAAGANGLPLVAASGEAAGVAYDQLATAAIEDDAITTAKIDDDAVTGPKIAAVQRWEPGDLKMSARSTPTAGWLLCDGSAVSRATYADLFTAIATTFGVGDGSTTFNLPDFGGKVLKGVGSGYARGATGGAVDATIGEANLPEHTHSFSATSGNQSATHTHPAGTLATGTTGSHQHSIPTRPDDGTSSGDFLPTAEQTTQALQQTNTNATGDHSHTITGSTGNASGDHTHSVSGNTGVGPGSGTAIDVEDPYLVANVFIKT